MNERKAPISGWVAFAAMMMLALGSFAFMAAVAGVLNGSWIVDSSILGPRVDWFWYGFFDLLWAGRAGGYVIGLVFSTLSVMRWFLLVLVAPLWSVTMVVMWGLVVYALLKTEDHPV